MASLDQRIADLEAELAAAQETVETLRRRLSGGPGTGDGGDPESDHAMARLQSRYEQKSEVLVQTESSYRILYDSFPDMVLTLDSVGKIQGCNRTAEIKLDRPEADLLGLLISDIFEPESGAALLEVCASGFEGFGSSEVSLPGDRKVSFSVNRVNPDCVQLVLRDLTPRQRLQDELLNMRRLASVGQLAGGIAHEVNNPLAVIQGRVEMLRAMPDMPTNTRERHLDVLEEHCRRVARIVQNLHTFARPRTPERRWLDFEAVLTAAVQSGGRRLTRVTLDSRVSEGLQVYADSDQLQLVLVNLLTTAAGVSPAGQPVQLEAISVGDGAIQVCVRDEGGGLSADLLDTLRSPYAGVSATVEPGRGLALSISWGIVQDHGGWLTAENGEIKGTEVQFQLPGSEPESDGIVTEGGQRWSVLIVDDDRVMCETIAWMLRTDGYRIVSVHSAEAAIAQIEADLPDIVITDQRLPGMDGEGLIAQLRQRWPELAARTVLTSGLLYRPQQTRWYLQKPFSRMQLLKLLRERVT